MTLKQKAIWFVITPISATIIWFALGFLLLWIDGRSLAGVPECDPRTFVRTNEYECAGILSFIGAFMMTFGVVTFGFALLGIVICIISLIWQLAKKSKKA